MNQIPNHFFSDLRVGEGYEFVGRGTEILKSSPVLIPMEVCALWIIISWSWSYSRKTGRRTEASP